MHHHVGVCNTFLDVIEEVSWNENVLSLIHGYYTNGKHFLFATINVLHYHFKVYVLSVDDVVVELPEWFFG
jgi:hypothetical protein